MKSVVSRAGHCLLVTLLFVYSAHSGAFGTLLTSPLERKTLDRQRQNKEELPLAVQNIKPTPAPESISFEGVVTRRSGAGNVWLNGQLLDQPLKSSALTKRHGKTGVQLKLQSAAHPVWLKPGQLLDVDSGEFSDAYLSDRGNSHSEQGKGEQSELYNENANQPLEAQ